MFQRLWETCPEGSPYLKKCPPTPVPTVTLDSLSRFTSSENLPLSEIIMLVYLLSAYGKVNSKNSKKRKILSVLVIGMSSIPEQSLVYSSY